MKQRIQKILEIILFFAIAAISVAIFFKRDQLQNVGYAGYLGVLALCFLSNATVLLPAPSLMIAAGSALILNPLLVAATAALGSSLGELVGYAFGSTGSDISPQLRMLLEKLSLRVIHPALLVFILALLPLPLFDLVGIYSGGTRMRLGKFFLLCFAGKFLKMLAYTRMYDILDWAASMSPL